MAKKSSDSPASPIPHQTPEDKRRRTIFVVTSDPSFYEGLTHKATGFPDGARRYASLAQLRAALPSFNGLNLAFVIMAERESRAVDIPELRELRLDYPQLVVLALFETCDQQSSLRLQSVGVHDILLPPFDRIDLEREIATVIPNPLNFKRNPDLMRRTQARLDMLVPSDLSYVLGVNHEISMLLKEFGFPPQDARINIPLACDEALTNAIIHGNDSSAEKKVNVQVYVSHGRFLIRVRDQGAGFDVSAVEDPTRGDNVMRSGGRGVYLMRNIMDRVEYKEGGRVLELEKRNGNVKDD